MLEPMTLNEFWEKTFGEDLHIWRWLMAEEQQLAFNLPFEDSGLTINPIDLDLTIITQFGSRLVDPLIAHMSRTAPQLCTWVYTHLLDRLKRYCDDFSAEYNPAENYISHETDDYKETPTGTDTTTDTYTNYKETQKYGHTVETNTGDNVFAYDTTGDTGLNYSKSGGSTTFKQGAGQDGDERSITGSKATTWSHGAKTDSLRTIDRHGNIGVKTAGEMLEGDLRFYELHNIIELIARDTAEILTIPAYL